MTLLYLLLFLLNRPFRTGITQPVLVSPDTTAWVGPIGSGVERKGEARGTVKNDITSYPPPSIPVTSLRGEGRGGNRKPISPRKDGRSNLE